MEYWTNQGVGGGPSYLTHQDFLGTGSAPSIPKQVGQNLKSQKEPLPKKLPVSSSKPSSRLGGLFFLLGCSSLPAIKKRAILDPNQIKLILPGINLEKESSLRVHLELVGQPNVYGQVLFLRQAHALPMSDGLSEYTDSMLFPKSPMLIEVARYQLAILRLLESLQPRPTHLFIEEPLTIEPHSNSALDLSPEEILKIKSLFSGELPQKIDLDKFMKDIRRKDLNEEDKKSLLQVLNLYKVGAPKIYKLRNENDGIALHRTTNREIRENWRNDMVPELYKNGIFTKEKWDEIVSDNFVYTKREQIATQQMISFLKKNPGERIILIYGAAHEFADDFKRNNHYPQLFSVEWRLPGTPRINELFDSEMKK